MFAVCAHSLFRSSDGAPTSHSEQDTLIYSRFLKGGCSGNRVQWFVWCYVLVYYIILPPSTAPLFDCTPLCRIPHKTPLFTIVPGLRERFLQYIKFTFLKIMSRNSDTNRTNVYTKMMNSTFCIIWKLWGSTWADSYLWAVRFHRTRGSPRVSQPRDSFLRELSLCESVVASPIRWGYGHDVTCDIAYAQSPY